MAREIVIAEDPQEIEQAFRQWGETLANAEQGGLPFDVFRRENARRCWAMLETIGVQVGAHDGDVRAALRSHGCGEDSAQWIAAKWLDAYEAALRVREAFLRDGDNQALGVLLDYHEDMGRLQERMWWRAGIDPETGERREKLALRERAASKSRKAGGTQNRNKAERWRAPARDLAAAVNSESPGLSVSECARRVIRRWDAPGIDPPKFESLRKILGKV